MTASDDFSAVEVPAAPETIRRFIEIHRLTYENDYLEIKNTVQNKLKDLDIYKVYGRDFVLGESLLKDPRKIRLKFNQHHIKNHNKNGSLWDVPDIVGFTIVVAYPSEISRVCEIIDSLIDDHTLGYRRHGTPSDIKASEYIKSKFGRPFENYGYFACHYNVYWITARTRNPICEIQIKTILHDGWQHKTHNLTYKNSQKLDTYIDKGFEILGDLLAKIDLHSDLMRSNIERSKEVRQRWLGLSEQFPGVL